jgi:DUF4097 and DUF4098 domain-containing protein YvlB
MRVTCCLGIVMAAGIGLAAPAAGQNQPERVTVPFSDPSRVGTVSVRLFSGSLTIHGADRRDVSVTSTRFDRSDRRARDNDSSAAGMRRLTSPSGLVVEEENNEMSVRTASFSNGSDLELSVPSHTNLKLNLLNGGGITVEGVQGELEVNNLNGPITLTNVSGSVVAHSTNGKVVASLRQVTANTPMAFTSLNGSVDVTLPADAKANLKMRTDNGDVFSDFDVALQQGAQAPKVEDSRRSGGRYRLEIDKSIYGSINGGGPEFELRTFNGNVYLRKGGQ